MPELHPNPRAQAEPSWAPTATTRDHAICIACANGYHDAPGPHAECACPCHQPPAAAITPRKQTDLREFYTNPVAFGLKLAGVR